MANSKWQMADQSQGTKARRHEGTEARRHEGLCGGTERRSDGVRLPQSPLMTACLVGYARGEESVREVLERHFFWQQPMREIAGELGVSVGFVQDHVRKFKAAAGRVGKSDGVTE